MNPQAVSIQPRLLKESVAGPYIGRSPGWLRNQRVKDAKALAEGRKPVGPQWVTVGRNIYYLLDALDEWIDTNAEPYAQVDRSQFTAKVATHRRK
jgi:hypothetical protein